jgi:hypothetical protein
MNKYHEETLRLRRVQREEAGFLDGVGWGIVY